MHEMAIAEGILDIAKEQAAKENSARILKICGREQPVEKYNFICPACGGGLAIVSGRELRVEYLEME